MFHIRRRGGVEKFIKSVAGPHYFTNFLTGKSTAYLFACIFPTDLPTSNLSINNANFRPASSYVR